MRYQTWGIARPKLYLLALFPALIWMAFRVTTQSDLSVHALFLYYRTWIWIWGGTLVLLSAVWIFLFRRGVFQARYVTYFFWLAEFLFELYESVQARNLWYLFASLSYLMLTVFVYRWLENWVESAPFNPKLYWYEGRPKVIPHLQAHVRFEPEGEWIPAKVRRMDRTGVFLMLDAPAEGARLKVGATYEFRVLAKKGETMGTGVLVGRLQAEQPESTSRKVAGLGLLFLPKDLYHWTEYTAVYESVRGEGYAF